MKPKNIPTGYENVNFLVRQFLQIRSSGPSVLYRKLVTMATSTAGILFLIFSSTWSIPCVVLLRCLRPWRRIRLGAINNEHIGHFVLESATHWAMRQQQSKHYLDLYWFSSVPDLYWISSKSCNDFWAKMVKRNFLVFPKFYLKPIASWNKILPGGAIHRSPIPTFPSGPAAPGDLLGKVPGPMSFLPDEDAEAKAWLCRQGWQEGEPFVCLLVRDSSFKGEHGRQGRFTFRNSDIATYATAAEWLAEQGVWVLRMGKKMAKPIPTNHPRIIDYAFHPEKSDLLDIWLFAHCDFCITTLSGPDQISAVYHRPLLALNFLPLELNYSWANAMHVPKKLVWQKSNSPLTCRECLDNYGESVDYLKYAGIQWIDLSSEEILAAVQERWQRLKGTWVDTKSSLDRHHRFWEIYKNHPDFPTYHSWVHPECRMGATWLESKGDAFLE
jgi:putative glycosyltransferase (TIGR04372 family)